MRIVGRDIEMLHSTVTGMQFAIKLHTLGLACGGCVQNKLHTLGLACGGCVRRVAREYGRRASDITPIWRIDVVRIGRVFVSSSVGAMRPSPLEPPVRTQLGLHSANCMQPSPLELPVRRTRAIRPSFGELHQAGSVASSSIAYACN